MSVLKHKGKGPQALTANELREGFSVWLTKEYSWSRNFEDALTTEDPDQIAKMQAQGEIDEAANKIVGVYFIDIEPDSGLPARYRENFRKNGPSWDTAADVINKTSAQNTTPEPPSSKRKDS